jgi:hypothetical protein
MDNPQRKTKFIERKAKKIIHRYFFCHWAIKIVSEKVFTFDYFILLNAELLFGEKRNKLDLPSRNFP